MEDFQFQVSYRGKIRQFYMPGESENNCDYSKLVENIVTNISSLFGIVFQIQFCNDEGEWITLSENICDIRDLFRCARPIANFRRIKLKIIEGCSPAPQHSQKDIEEEHEEEVEYTHSPKRKKPKRLDFEDYLSSYKSPIDLDIEAKKEELDTMEIRLISYEEEYERTAFKYSGGSTRQSNKSGKQCGKCHLFQNHRKNNCPNDTCVSAIMCGDVTKHPEESGELRDVADRKNKLSMDLKKAKQELELKLKVKNKMNSSFEKRLEPILIESNRKKYLADTTFGIRPRQALLNEDLAILERHYKGVYPRDIAYEKNNFQKIIARANKELSGTRKPESSVRDMLTNNPIYSVNFPKSASATHSNPESAPPLPLGPPPQAPEPPIAPPALYQSPQQMMLPWTYWYCSPPPNDGKQSENDGDQA